MKNIVIAVMTGAVLAAAPAIAAPVPAEFCRIVADDSAYIMGVRQRGEPMASIEHAINWQKYDTDPVLRELAIMLMALAWEVPIQGSSQERQAASAEFARINFEACRKAR